MNRIFAYHINDFIDFGKYRNTKIEKILKEDPDYLNWCLDNIPFFKCTEGLKAEIEKACEKTENGKC